MPKNSLANERRERAKNIAHLLDRNSPPAISFLDRQDPFGLLISVVLSAQTTDAQVNKIIHQLLGRFPTPADLAHANLDEVMKFVRSTGFFRLKSERIIALSQQLVELYSGQVPLSMEELTALPGVGRKSANVLLGQLANQPAIIVDTHFARVVRRLDLSSAKQPEAIEREIQALLPFELHYRFSMTINLHGRTICLARGPKCAECLLCSWCPSCHIQ